MPTLIEALYTYQKAVHAHEQAYEAHCKAHNETNRKAEAAAQRKHELEQAEYNLLYAAKKGAL